MTPPLRWTSHFAGSFYPEVPAALEQELAAWMESEPRYPGAVHGVLVPHAGYVYSGRTAARAVARARSEMVRTVVLLAPSHRHPVDAVANLALEGFDTPLGGVDVDPQWVERAGLDGCGVQRAAPFAEHALEVQLPLVQRAWPNARVVPLVFGRCAEELTRALGAAIAAAWTPECVVLATSDLSHYHDRATARRLDDRFEQELVGGDAVSLVDALLDQSTEACGVGPVLTWMEMNRALGGHIEVVERSDSGEAYGETERVVGYLSALAVATTSAMQRGGNA